MSAVFDTSKHSRDNPFLESQVQQSFYHPSLAQPVDDMTKQTTLSVVQRSWEVSGDQSPSDNRFLKASLYYTSKFPTSDGISPGGGSSKFNESWPDSEKPSSLSVSGNASFAGELYSPQSQLWTSSPKEKDTVRERGHLDHVPERDLTSGHSFTHGTDGSVLSKYVDRFRHGSPLSREEREKAGTVKSQDFWWLSADGVRGSYDGIKSRHLEEKAERLLQRTVSSLGSSEPIVSTDGLGSSVSETPRSLHEESYRPAFTRTPVTERDSSRPPPRRQTPPEDDILAQWRLRCRMEEARHNVAYRQTDSHKQDKAGSFSAKLDDSTDSRLAEFRRRLASGRLVDASAVTTDWSPSVQELERHMSRAAVDIDRERRGSTTVTTNTVPIASPSVPPGTQLTRKGEDVVPHLHLSCDILQCTHEHQQARQGDTWRQCQSAGDRTDTHEIAVYDHPQSRDDNLPHPNARLTSNVETQCSTDPSHHGRGYVLGQHNDHSGNYEERGRVERDDRSESDRFEDTDRLKHRTRPMSLHKDVSRHKDSDRDQLAHEDGRGDMSRRHAVPERDGRVRLTSGDDVTYTEDTSSRRKKKPKHSDSLHEGNTQLQGFYTNTGDGTGHTQHTRRPASKTNKTRQPNRESATEDGEDVLWSTTHSDAADGRRKKSGMTSLGRPSHSSPTRSVTSAIGQVVGSQLFGSSASLTSSMDSSCDLVRPRSPVTSPPDLATTLCSDSEEFADDEVLVDLRNRRAAYLKKLASVNKALERYT